MGTLKKALRADMGNNQAELFIKFLYKISGIWRIDYVVNYLRDKIMNLLDVQNVIIFFKNELEEKYETRF